MYLMKRFGLSVSIPVLLGLAVSFWSVKQLTVIRLDSTVHPAPKQLKKKGGGCVIL